MEKITPQNVEYYFDCRLDREIPLSDLCDGVKRLKSKGQPIDIDIECPEYVSTAGTSIYRSSVTDREDCD